MPTFITFLQMVMNLISKQQECHKSIASFEIKDGIPEVSGQTARYLNRFKILKKRCRPASLTNFYKNQPSILVRFGAV